MHLARLLVGVGARWEIWCSRAIVIYFSFADAYLSVAPNLSNTAAAGVWIELNGAFLVCSVLGPFFFRCITGRSKINKNRHCVFRFVYLEKKQKEAKILQI